MNSRSLTRILHELNPVASIVIASRPKAAWRSRLLDCFVVSPRNDGHACTLYLPLSPQGTVCPLKYPALTGFPALFHALKHRFALSLMQYPGVRPESCDCPSWREANPLIQRHGDGNRVL